MMCIDRYGTSQAASLASNAVVVSNRQHCANAIDSSIARVYHYFYRLAILIFDYLFQRVMVDCLDQRDTVLVLALEHCKCSSVATAIHRR